jgi:AGZA family xanthine/uracil permease-like MFS transporter
MSYIAVVNPSILSAAGFEFGPLVTATVLAAAFGSILMGAFARLPYALAPGMGLNAFFAYELVLARGIPKEQALGLVVLSGAVFVVLSVTPVRRWVAEAIPASLREAIAAGIGIFLAYIGLKNAGLIVPSVPPGDPSAWRTMLGPLGGEHLLFLFGLVLAAALHRAGKPYAFLASIGITTLLALVFGPSGADAWASWPEQVVSLPDLSLVFAADLKGSLQVALLPPLVTLLFTDLFDSLSTFLGVAQAADLVDERGEPLRVEEALLVDAAATLASGLVGTSPATAYVESTAGIEAGGRTGLTAVVAGLAFLPLLFFAPLLGVIPIFATAPVLVIVGALMARAAFRSGPRPLEDAIPAFAVMILIPLSFSITHGILWGLVLLPILYLLAGRGREVAPTLWALCAIAVGLLAMEAGG